jgi:hypothetical protein
LASFPTRISDHLAIHNRELDGTIGEERGVKGSVVIIGRIPHHLKLDRSGLECADERSPAIVASSANIRFTLFDC